MKHCLATEKELSDGGINMTDGLSAGYCFGMTQGVRDTMKIVGEKLPDYMKICFPDSEITNGQAVRIAISYLKKSSALLHLDDSDLIILAYKDTYPCN